jgi:SAM-dependent methyltransferase
VHDIRTERLPRGAFDVVHARLLLSHLPDPDAALAKLAAGVKPGGWLLVEDFDHLTCGQVDPVEAPERARVYQALWSADLRFVSEQGVQLDLGRRLFRIFHMQGLTSITAVRSRAFQRTALPTPGFCIWAGCPSVRRTVPWA